MYKYTHYFQTKQDFIQKKYSISNICVHEFLTIKPIGAKSRTAEAAKIFRE
jgi:hypothetical protein